MNSVRLDLEIRESNKEINLMEDITKKEDNLTVESKNDIIDEVAFSKLNGIIVDDVPDTEAAYNPKVVTFAKEMEGLGYRVSLKLYLYLCNMDSTGIVIKCTDILSMARKNVGAHVRWEPMYPNFPTQVMEASEGELFFNLIIHYMTGYLPVYAKDTRPEMDEEHPITTISIIHTNHVKQYFFTLLSSKSSIPNSLVAFVNEAIELGWNLEYSGDISFKETLCMVATNQLKKGESITNVVKTSTDILRVMAAMSYGHIGLLAPVKFKSLNRKTRRLIVTALEEVISESDVKPYSGLWKIAFHSLHVGEYGGRVASVAKRFRNERNVATSETIICEAIKTGNVRLAVDQLVAKPSVFARNLDKLLRETNEDVDYVILQFERVIDRTSSKVLLQSLGHFKGRKLHESQKRLVVTLGSKGRVLLAGTLKPLSQDTVARVIEVITCGLKNMFAGKELLKGKKVFIQPAAMNVLLPLQMSSASETKRSVSRGSRIPLDLIPEDKDKNFLRMFIHWIGEDQDLSACFIDESFSKVAHVAYTNMVLPYSWHSGDITGAPAPNGASEFIDLDMQKALGAGIRYVLMDVRVYTAQVFLHHSVSFSGYMMLKDHTSGEVFEPRSVRSKFDMTSDTRSVVSCAFDLKERCMIWMDCPLDTGAFKNDVASNFKQVMETLRLFISLHNSKVSVAELVKIHAAAGMAIFVDNIEEADFTVGLGEGELDVYDFTKINSKWI